MNFLWIIQVLGFIFILKNSISNSFYQFNSVLDWASFSRECRGYGVKFVRLRKQKRGTVGWFL
jgi:hypothetical protein